MSGRSKPATEAAPVAQHPAALRGRNEKGSVRPADDRYLDDAKLDERDAYLMEQTGPEAQQLVVKRETLRAALDKVTDEQLAVYDFEGSRDALVESANTMPWAQYRDVLDALEALSDVEPTALAEPDF